ncbi:ketoacyl-ACP synthase III family protein [Amycolatopsis sp. CA-230715]|uniref:ketoacyl-ACP synthase III family protein n=1 Tax=Amycolatopsis sp. CA-230715 TaxID=2745196 RepID=UPI001C0331DE|nr:ketoacyl-ACP synthase III family protein [Amycolatopsis sp. CA-230715]QWF82454.1 hypothetical protein HUW46_05891 [Amycolatopsis sp. CA-230715]
MKPHGLFLRGIGVHLPEGRITADEAVAAGYCGAEQIAHSGLLSVAAGDGTSGVDMAVAAGREALSDADVKPGDLDLLVHATMLPEGPDGWSPAGYVLRELGCDPGPCHEVRQGCNGMFAAMELAAGWLALSEHAATALLTTALRGESPLMDRWRSAGFGMHVGDAGCAVLLGREHGIARVDAVCSTTFPELEGLHRGAAPPSEETAVRDGPIDVVTRSGEFVAAAGYDPFELRRMFTAMYFSAARQAMAEAEVDAGELARVVFVNAGAPFVDLGIMQPLGLPMAKSTWDFGRTVGHLGACDQVVSLHHLLATGQLSAGDRVLMVGGTQGYNAASAVLTVTTER